MSEPVTPEDILVAIFDYRNMAEDLDEQAQMTPYDHSYRLTPEIGRFERAKERFGERLSAYVRQEIADYLMQNGYTEE